MVPDVELLQRANPGVFGEVVLNNGYGLVHGCFKDWLVVDVGAHMGSFAYLASTLGKAKTVLCVEPNPKNFSVLAAVFKHSTDVILWHKAVSHNHDMVMISDEDNNSKVGCGTPVEAFPLDDIPAMFPASRSKAVLKIDVEGSEYNALWSAARASVTFYRTILIETHGRRLLNAAMKLYLEQFGFRRTACERMFRWDVLPSGEKINMTPLPAWVSRFDL